MCFINLFPFHCSFSLLKGTTILHAGFWVVLVDLYYYFHSHSLSESWLPTPPSMIWWLVCVVCMLAYPCTFIICSFYNIGSVSCMIFKWLSVFLLVSLIIDYSSTGFNVWQFECWVFCWQVKLVKCLVLNIVVDISFNQLGGLCTLCFLEQVAFSVNSLM